MDDGTELAGPVVLLADRLALLYPDELSIRRVLALARVDARRIVISGHAANTWWAAVNEAAHQGRLTALVDVALEEYGQDAWLNAIHAQLIRRGGA
jgi:hypothetical protein